MTLSVRRQLGAAMRVVLQFCEAICGERATARLMKGATMGGAGDSVHFARPGTIAWKVAREVKTSNRVMSRRRRLEDVPEDLVHDAVAEHHVVKAGREQKVVDPDEDSREGLTVWHTDEALEGCEEVIDAIGCEFILQLAGKLGDDDEDEEPPEQGKEHRGSGWGGPARTSCRV